ncbi:hypothetical protein CL621_03305 [archaeon]|nr:hypothetical protein [archaeon]|tara:strand:+ start:43 stop:351 length:309 start_codon:yes stop_codon:yes gene_type:complete
MPRRKSRNTIRKSILEKIDKVFINLNNYHGDYEPFTFEEDCESVRFSSDELMEIQELLKIAPFAFTPDEYNNLCLRDEVKTMSIEEIRYLDENKSNKEFSKK